MSLCKFFLTSVALLWRGGGGEEKSDAIVEGERKKSDASVEGEKGRNLTPVWREREEKI